MTATNSFVNEIIEILRFAQDFIKRGHVPQKKKGEEFDLIPENP